MGAGKALAIVSGILGLVAIFLLNWISVAIPGTFVYGVNGAMNLLTYFTDTASVVTALDLDPSMSWLSYVVGVLIVLFLLSGIFMLIGAKSRALAIIGGLFPLLAGLIILLNGFNVFDSLINNYQIDLAGYIETIFSGDTVIVENILPYSLVIPGLNMELGALLLLVSGLLGFISGLMGRDEYY